VLLELCLKVIQLGALGHTEDHELEARDSVSMRQLKKVGNATKPDSWSIRLSEADLPNIHQSTLADIG